MSNSFIIWGAVSLYRCLWMCLLALCLLGTECIASSSEELHHLLQKKKDQISVKKEHLSELTEKERQFFQEVAEIEKRVALLEEEYAQEKRLYQQAATSKKRLQRQASRLEDSIEASQQEIRRIVQNLWPILLKKKTLSLGSFNSWQEMDRNVTWLSFLFSGLDHKIKNLSQSREDLEETLTQQGNIQRRLQDGIKILHATKEDLLDERLQYLHKVQHVRAKKLVIEEQLSQIQETIDQLEYKWKHVDTHQIQRLKGTLPWPVKGEILCAYDVQTTPPHTGIGFALSKESQIRSIAWGKVVYNATLRGFGKVVIVYHGDDYYSLYAFLSDVSVQLGKKVKQGELLGRAGYYPKNQGPGMYFELRYEKRPINPSQWLLPRQ
jgi:septal ring factor EnvC (AmiA/AmiB activator)